MDVLPFFSFLYDYLRTFQNIVVHPSQEMRPPEGAYFRGGPEWPRFGSQVLARHCLGALPRPVDSEPLPALPEWPYFDPQLLLVQLPIEDCKRGLAELREIHAFSSGPPVETADEGIWCGPIIMHFGHMIGDFGMRIAASSRVDPIRPLVFTMPPLRNIEPPHYFWDILDHLGVDRERVLLIRKPTRFHQLYVLPQAERRLGGGPSRRHLRLMDEITASSQPSHRDLDYVYVSRAKLSVGRFAGESYLEEVLTAAGVTVFHPETVDLHAQLRFYRRARCLIFAEGSALHALQLLGHVDSDISILVRRPGTYMMGTSLRPRARSLRYIRAVRGFVPGVSRSGQVTRRTGISVLDESLCIAGFHSLGIDLAPFWRLRDYAERRDADIAAWIRHQHTNGSHPTAQAIIDHRLRDLCLQVPEISN